MDDEGSIERHLATCQGVSVRPSSRSGSALVGVIVLAGLTLFVGSGPVSPETPDHGPDRSTTSADASIPGASNSPAIGVMSSLDSLAPSFGPTATPVASSVLSPTLRPRLSTTPGPEQMPAVPPAPNPTPRPKPTPIPPLSACRIFPASDVWNQRVDRLPVDPRSATFIAAIGLPARLHPDFSNAGGYGIPFNVVGTSTPRSNVAFDYASESDHVAYPIPPSPRIEGGSDRHLLMVDTIACRLYELYDAVHRSSGWTAGSGATWNLRSNALRPDGWTSADAAGLPIFPGLVRADQVLAGGILHALRFTAPRTCAGHIAPARHDAGSGSCAVLPPMGLRVRLKASVDLTGFGPQARTVLVALQRYGMILADNGSPWYVTGAPDGRWNDNDLHALGRITGADLEVVDTSSIAS